MNEAIAIDIGGSSIKAATVQDDGSLSLVGNRHEDNKERTVGHLLGSVLRLVETQIDAGFRGSAVGISTTGSVDLNGIVKKGGFFRGYENFDWRSEITSRYPAIRQVVVINDGHASALGVALADKVGREFRTIAHFVVGTGVGGGIVIERRLWIGAHGFSSRFGHIKIARTSSLPCSCRRRGCVETFASGTAIVAAAERRLGEKRNIRELAELMAQGAPVADLFESAGSALGVAIADVMNVLDPDLITLGGGVVAAAWQNGTNVYFEAAKREACTRAISRNAAATKLMISNVGNDAALYGAGSLALRRNEGLLAGPDGNVP